MTIWAHGMGLLLADSLGTGALTLTLSSFRGMMGEGTIPYVIPAFAGIHVLRQKELN